eukprot:887208-Alexandrium_andersonii.AAC.1
MCIRDRLSAEVSSSSNGRDARARQTDRQTPVVSGRGGWAGTFVHDHMNPHMRYTTYGVNGQWSGWSGGACGHDQRDR